MIAYPAFLALDNSRTAVFHRRPTRTTLINSDKNARENRSRFNTINGAYSWRTGFGNKFGSRIRNVMNIWF